MCMNNPIRMSKDGLANHCWKCERTTIWTYQGKFNLGEVKRDMYECRICGSYATRRVLHIMEREAKQLRRKK